MSAELDSSKIIRVERIIAAPRDLVFEAFSDAKHLDAWWGPDGFTNETHEMDFSVGGLWRYTMHGADGKAWPNWIRYTEISAPSRIAYDHGGELGEPAHFVGIITFEELAQKTRVAITLVFETTQARDATVEFGAVAGGGQTLAKLERYVLGRQKPSA
ncbi:SRPBCC family protein [Hoeflea sp. G2-23]|uniref:SRPBCC family protein n=1 Tax=Hoeflea algicola TaxID=2983763 RepID=A0ABT3Z8H4_9HYPH|nr:SRPBCC family protein [Hoeflea algicola]MCY0147963.1 SRPBCC family protein [Hoeflea algicola]